MKQHAVPENIMDVEFKLFGSLTAKQFGYIIAGGLGGLFLYYTFKGLGSNLLAFMFAFLSVILGISLALIRINDQPFEVWLGNFVAAMFTSQKRVWKKEKKTPAVLSNEKVGVQKSTGILPNVVQPGARVHSQIQYTRQPTTISTSPTQQTMQPPQQQNAVPALPQHPFKSMNQVPSSPPLQSASQSPNPADLAGPGTDDVVHYVPGSAQGVVKLSFNQTPNRPITLDQSVPAMNSNQNDSQDTTVTKPSPVLNSIQDQGQITNSPSPDDGQYGSPSVQSSVGGNQVTNSYGNTGGSAVTEDLLGQSGVLQVSSQQTASVPAVPTATSPSNVNKAQQFDDIVPTRQEVIPSVTEPASASPVDDISSQSGDMREENAALRTQLADFAEEKQKVESELSQTKQLYDELKTQNSTILQQLENMKNELEQMRRQDATTLPPISSPTTSINQGVVQDDDENMFAPRVYNGPSLTKKPNVVSGIVKTKEGKLLPGVVVIVKDPQKSQPRPIRAMKTNSLGQFITTSAIEENGTYVIELSKNGFTFGRYEIELKGDVLPTYEFVAE